MSTQTGRARSILCRRWNARRGFSTLVVIMSMVFVGMAVMAMSTLFAHEARRSHGVAAEAQLRQLLLAAMPAAQTEIMTAGTRAVNLAVPVEGAEVVLRIKAGEAGGTVHVEARYQGFKASQTLVFVDGKLTEATLGQTGGQ